MEGLVLKRVETYVEIQEIENFQDMETFQDIENFLDIYIFQDMGIILDMEIILYMEVKYHALYCTKIGKRKQICRQMYNLYA